MPVTLSIHDGQLRLQISGSFTIFQAREYKTQLLNEMAHPGELLELDLSAVEEIDTAGLQLLLLMRREAAAHHKRMVCKSMSPVVENMIEMLQLQHIFPLTPSVRQEPV